MQLVEYIKKQRRAGYSDDMLQLAISKEGYSDKEIELAFKLASGDSLSKNSLGQKFNFNFPAYAYYIIAIVVLLSIVVTAITIDMSSSEPPSQHLTTPKIPVGSYTSLKSLFNNLSGIMLQYSILFPDPNRAASVTIYKQKNITKSDITVVVYGKPINLTYYSAGDFNFLCDDSGCMKVNESSILPKLDLISNEFVYEGESTYNQHKCYKFHAQTRYHFSNRFIPSSPEEALWNYEICVNPDYGYEYYYKVVAYNNTSPENQVINYSIKLDKFSFYSTPLDAPDFYVESLNCDNSNIDGFLRVISPIPPQSWNATLSFFTLQLDSKKLNFDSLTPGQIKKIKFSVSGLQPGDYTIRVCNQKFCSVNTVQC